MTPSFKEEKKLWKKGFKRIVGLDEVGRGPLAGPVVACAVIINGQKPKIKNIKDSKQLSARQRERIFQKLIHHPDVEWGIGAASEKVIDKINILEATKLAMVRAVNNLDSKLTDVGHPKICRDVRHPKIDFLILDGNFSIKSDIPQKSIIKADEKVFSCSCASIIAKVTRDRLMQKYDRKYSCYDFASNKGYPTRYHRAMIKKYGPSRIHRKTFTLV